MKPIQKLQAFLLAVVFLNFSLGIGNIYAQTTTDSTTKKYVGAESDIKRFLCAPTDASEGVSQNETWTGPATTGAQNPASNDLYNCINRLYRFAIVLASSVGLLFFVIAGYLYMSSDGNKEAVDKAKAIITSTITSLVILFIGYVLLRALNPDLVRFPNLQPLSVQVQTSRVPAFTQLSDGTYQIQGGAGKTAAELEANGCTFDSDVQKKEIPNLTTEMFEVVKTLCFNTRKDVGKIARISSVIGPNKHAKNSYHYKGCAIDFGDDTTSVSGKELIAEATALKSRFPGIRINPGTDATKTNHVHIDLGSSCIAEIKDPPATDN